LDGSNAPINGNGGIRLSIIKRCCGSRDFPSYGQFNPNYTKPVPSMESPRSLHQAKEKLRSSSFTGDDLLCITLSKPTITKKPHYGTAVPYGGFFMPVDNKLSIHGYGC